MSYRISVDGPPPADVPKDRLNARIENRVEKAPILPDAFQDAIHIVEKGDRASKEYETSAAAVDAANTIYVEFTEGDSRNPMNFSRPRKWLITIVACAMTGITAASGGSIALGFPSMVRDLNATSELAALTLSMYSLGFAIFPLVTASLSEEFGRRPLFFVSSVVFMLMHIMFSAAKNISTVIIARLISGAAGSVGATMVGGVIADIWAPYERGIPMSLFALAAIGGTGLGPVFAGFIEQNSRLEWRWIQWIQSMVAGVLVIAIYAVLDETRSGVILTREARELRKKTGDSRHRARIEDENPPLKQLIYISCTRPLYLLLTEPVVASFSYSWGVLFSQIESIALIFRTLHHFNSAQVGLAFSPMCIGALLGFIINIYQESLYRQHVKKRGPEARLYAAMAAAILFPIGCFIYAWTAQPSIRSWVGPMFGIFIFITALFSMYLAVFSYLADAYGIYASSALAGQSLCRNIMGAAFPLFTNQMYTRLSFPWASTLFGCLAAFLAVVPFILFMHGPKIRGRSRFASKLAERGEDWNESSLSDDDKLS
ncbi:MFS polyamine transporter [Hysterangium stoloniferum]|nr:MFS polyamine transporter [Hysterangium stoloniferum]